MTSKQLSSAKLFLYLLLGGILSLAGITPLGWKYWIICLIILAIDNIHKRVVDQAVKNKIVTTELNYSSVEELLSNINEN